MMRVELLKGMTKQFCCNLTVLVGLVLLCMQGLSCTPGTEIDFNEVGELIERGGGDCDQDDDGARARFCGGDDCDDYDAAFFPGAMEICDGLDNNCNDIKDENQVCLGVSWSVERILQGQRSPTEMVLDLGQSNNVAVGPDGSVYVIDSNQVLRMKENRVWAVAGISGYRGFGIDGVLGTASTLSFPQGVFVNDAGDLWIADTSNSRVRKVDARTGMIKTVAGRGRNQFGAGGFGGDGGLATEAQLNLPFRIFVDSNENLWIADSLNHCIRKVDHETQIIQTVAGICNPGIGEGGFDGDGGPALEARLSRPHGIFVNDEGDLWIADHDNRRVRKVDGVTGIITTVAGDGRGIAGGNADTIGDGGLAVDAAIARPTDVFVDDADDLWIVDTSNDSVRKVDHETQIIRTVIGGGRFGIGSDNIGDGGLASDAELRNPAGIWIEEGGQGDVWIADNLHNRIRKVDSETNIISTFAGGGRFSDYMRDGEKATRAVLRRPGKIFVDDEENLWISDTGHHRIRRVDGVTGVINTVAGNSESFSEAGFLLDWVQATETPLNFPNGVFVNQEGNFWIVDSSNDRVRKVFNGAGFITPYAGDRRNGGEVVDEDGQLVSDGGLATEADLDSPSGMHMNEAGDVWIADTWNHRIRKVDGETGIITTVAGRGEVGFDAGSFGGDGVLATETELDRPQDVYVNDAGDIWIADTWNHRIRKVDGATGIITTVAGNGEEPGPFFNPENQGDGGPATEAPLNQPEAIFVDGDENVWIADTRNHRVAKVDAETGIITTVAGNNSNSGLFALGDGDGGLATESKLFEPSGIFVNEAGDVWITEKQNDRVRKIDGATGIITTVVGSTYQPEGVGRFADAWVDLPQALIPRPSGEGFLISSTSNGRVYQADLSSEDLDVVIGYPLGFEEGYYSESVRPEHWFENEVPAKYAEGLFHPSGMAYDAEAQHLYICEAAEHRIRLVRLHDEDDPASWSLSTYAGSVRGFSGFENGEINEARFNYPTSMVFNRRDRLLYVADEKNFDVRVIDVDEAQVSSLDFARDEEAANLPPVRVRPTLVSMDASENLWMVSVDSLGFSYVYGFRLEEDGRRAVLFANVGRNQMGEDPGFEVIEDGMQAGDIALPHVRGLTFKANGDLLLSSLNQIILVHAREGSINSTSPVQVVYRASEDDALPFGQGGFVEEVPQLLGGLYWEESTQTLFALEVLQGHLLRLQLDLED